MEQFIIALVILGVFLTAFVAYIVNIVKLVRSKEMNGLTLARLCGIFVFPLGAILGFVSN